MAGSLAAVGVGVASFVAMEPLTALAHRTVMHGAGIVLHRSHHRNAANGSVERWEANDAFPLAIAAIVMIGLAIGFNVAGFGMLVPIGAGITVYGLAYATVHDAYTHRRLPIFGGRRIAVLDRLAAAHEVHHRVGGAPYGMLLPMSPRSGSRPSHSPDDATG